MQKDKSKERRANRPRATVKRLKSEEELDKAVVTRPEEPGALSTTPQGNALVPSEFFHGPYSPNLDYYLQESGLVLTEEEKKVLAAGVKQKTRGLSAAIPLKCSGPRCPFKDQCPLFKIGKAPIGLACTVESMLMDLYTKRYLDEFSVATGSFSEVTVMTQLAATHVMEMRAWKVLAEENNATGIIENVVGFNEDGDSITQYQEHPAYNILERAWRWRDRLLTSLVGTRREQYKKESALKQKAGDDSLSKRAAELKFQIESMGRVDLDD